MKKYAETYHADDGCIFVVTPAGYERTLDHIKPERAVGKPIQNFETCVPISWVEKGWVEERRVSQ